MIIKKIKEGQTAPRFYGLVKRDWVRNEYVLAPMPFNLILGLFWALLANIRWSWIQVLMSPRDAYWQGVAEGMGEAQLEFDKQEKEFEKRIDALTDQIALLEDINHHSVNNLPKPKEMCGKIWYLTIIKYDDNNFGISSSGMMSTEDKKKAIKYYFKGE